MGKAWWQPCEVAVHMTSEVRKQRVMDTHAQLAVSFSFSLRPQPMEWYHPHSGWGFPPQAKLSGSILIDTSRDLFPIVTLNLIRLTDKVNNHNMAQV